MSPDEFKIVSHSPLTMPPNAELRPPRPGEPRPQEVTPADQAREALAPQTAGRAQRGAGGNAPPAPGGASEQALVAKAGQGGIDPNIRSRVNTDTRTINDSDKTLRRQPDLLAGQAAVGRRARSGQGTAADARRPGGRPDRRRAPRRRSRDASAACSKASSECADAPPPRPARRPRRAARSWRRRSRPWRSCSPSGAGRPRASPWPTACRSSCCRRAARRS